MSDIVTKEMLESYRAKHWILEGELTYNTITQAVELLERCVHPADIDALKQAKRDAAEWLARYHAGEKTLTTKDIGTDGWK